MAVCLTVEGDDLSKNYILVDNENVQPTDLAALDGHEVRVLVFLGENQAKLSSRFASSMQALGNDGTYVHIDGNGRNALDFHVAFYLGELAKENPDGFFHIISKDKGFDPLVRHLRGRRVRAHRVDALSKLPFLGTPDSSSREAISSRCRASLTRDCIASASSSRSRSNSWSVGCASIQYDRWSSSGENWRMSSFACR